MTDVTPTRADKLPAKAYKHCAPTELRPGSFPEFASNILCSHTPKTRQFIYSLQSISGHLNQCNSFAICGYQENSRKVLENWRVRPKQVRK